jgi:hypothetical protein
VAVSRLPVSFDRDGTSVLGAEAFLDYDFEGHIRCLL